MTSASDADPAQVDRWVEGVEWFAPTFPHTPLDPDDAEPRLQEVRSALLTRVRQGPLRTAQVPTRWITGAVHDADGLLIPASQKIGGLGGNELAQADPRRATARDDTPVLTGTHLYGGHWIGHFGHFMTETVTTLWPEREALGQIDGLVFHRYSGRFAGVQTWQQELLDLAGYGDLPVVVIDERPRRVERLVLPNRSVVVNGWAHEGAGRVWGRIAAAAATSQPEGDGAKVFLSRRGFNARKRAEGATVRTSPQRDDRLDRVFGDAGFLVVEPESLALRDQVRLAAEASVLAGSAGTALHLAAFSPSSTRVIEIGDSRSPTVQVPHQRVIDTVGGHASAYVPHAIPVPRLRQVLRNLGVWGT
ncbi:DUF563 domain-containing protein [Nocardioides sp. R-C-SC26]|uniref:glycosyltransferase family 61 protein n=1 Tax=Nocardioides sp. R-C-SC26 TaxID=2870414 RepID=UPI001E5B8530|nr:glycosyltransferase 61 family protein [Nocardioides sp. R-C-SC26]